MVEGILSGVKAVEYCSSVAGAYCTKLFADLGAEVIKIEAHGLGDESRRQGPFLHDIPHPELSGLFLYLNTNKLGVTLDINSPIGKDIFKRLLAQADIMVEDMPPGGMEELGLGYDSLKEIFPSLIMASISPFGQTGPYRNYKSYHLNTFHASGAGYLLPTSSPDLKREPIKGPGLLGEYDAGISAAVAIISALYWRRAGGVGQHIDVSKQEAIMHLEKVFLAKLYDEGKSPTRTAIGSRAVVLRCKRDDYILIEYYLDHQWQGLVEAMGNPEWTKDEKFSTSQKRQQNVVELQNMMAGWAKNYTSEEVFHLVQSHGCPGAPVNSPEHLLNSPQMEARCFFTEIDHPIAGRLKYPSRPYIFSKVQRHADRHAPLLGEHNKVVFCHHLGYTKKELIKFKHAGVI